MAEANEGTQENYDLETSRNLNSILDGFGLTKRIISNRRYNMQLLSIMSNLDLRLATTGSEIISYMSGSTVEGVASIADQNSDIDIMKILAINVINGIDQIDNQVKRFPIQRGVYVLEDSISNCLFKRLRFMLGENYWCHYYHSNGYMYLSHADLSDHCHDFRERLKMNRNKYGLPTVNTVENCGPSLATCTEATSSQMNMDFVRSIFCPFWPNEISDFFVRHRTQQWPTPRDLDLIIRNGCHLVAKGFVGSIEYDIEWRLSFSFAENILIRSFNNIQMKCYFLLKAFLKRNIKLRFPKLLCSYHMKTVMFWVCEEIGPNPFKEEFLLKCCRLCIDRVRSYLLEEHFPCYFARESNLFSEKVPGEAYRKLAEFLSIVYHEETITTFVYYLRGKLQIFKTAYLPYEKFLPFSTHPISFRFAMESYIGICERKSTKEIQSFLNCTIFDIIKKCLFNVHPEFNILNILRQIVFPDLAFTAIAILYRRQLRNKVHYALQKQYLQFMANELAVTHCKGLLKRATVYYKTGQITRCMVISVNVINLLTTTRAICLGAHLKEIDRFAFQHLFGENMSPDGNFYTTPNVIFSELDKPLVPDFVIEEINFDEHMEDRSTKGWAYLDPVIYAYGLAIICQHDLLDFAARDQFLQELQHFFLQNKQNICYCNSAKRIIDRFNEQFFRQ